MDWAGLCVKMVGPPSAAGSITGAKLIPDHARDKWLLQEIPLYNDTVQQHHILENWRHDLVIDTANPPGIVNCTIDYQDEPPDSSTVSLGQFELGIGRKYSMTVGEN